MSSPFIPSPPHNHRASLLATVHLSPCLAFPIPSPPSSLTPSLTSLRTPPLIPSHTSPSHVRFRLHASTAPDKLIPPSSNNSNLAAVLHHPNSTALPENLPPPPPPLLPYPQPCSPHAPRAMNALASLNLASHDEGVAAISNFPLALDWLAIPIPSSALSPLHSQLSLPTTSPQAVPLTFKQASSSIVRTIHPYASREVFAPCFRVANRFILGRTLGNLYVPTELSLPHLAADRNPDARFVLDLQHGSIVEVRHYPASSVLLCVAHAARHAEYVTLPPAHFARVEISYRRDHSQHVQGTATAAVRHSATHLQHDFGTLFEHPSAVTRIIPSHSSWHHFCTNYAAVLPTGPVVATVSAEPGPHAATVKNELITVSLNDPYPMSFSYSQPTSRAGGSQARRIAPKRLLPRPSP